MSCVEIANNDQMLNKSPFYMQINEANKLLNSVLTSSRVEYKF